MLIQYGEYAMHGDVYPWNSDQLPWIALQGVDSIGEKGVVWAPSMAIHHQIPTSALISDGVIHVLILEDWQVDFHMASKVPAALFAMVWKPGTSRSIRPWWHWWEVDTVFGHSQTQNLEKVKVMGVGAVHKSHCLWLWSWPHCNAWPCSWYDTLWLCLGTSNCSAAVWGLTPHRDSSWLQDLNGGDTGKIEWGCLGLLGSMHCPVMAWAINYQPSSKLTALVLSWASLPTQLIFPDSMNMALALCPSSVLLLKTVFHRKGWPGWGPSLLLLLGQICHLRAFLPQPVPAKHVGVVV